MNDSTNPGIPEDIDNILNALIDGTFIYSVDGKLQYLNEAGANMYGYAKEEMLALHPTDFIHPDYLYLFEEFRLALLNGEEYRCELVAIKKDGSTFEALVYGGPININKEPHLYATTRDVTERNEVVRALKEGEMKFRSIVQDQTEMIVRWKPGGVRTFANHAYCKAFGIDEEEVVGTNFLDLILEKDKEEVENRIKRLTPTHPISSAVHQVKLPNDQTGWHEWTDRAFFDDENRVIEYQSVGRDITEQKSMEEQLKRSLLFLEKAQSLARIGIWRWSVVNNKVTWSPELYSIYGIANEKDFEGTFEGYLSRVHSDDREHAKKNVERAMKQKVPVTFEERIITPDKETRCLRSWAGVTLSEDGRVVELVGACLDVTDRKRSEMKLQESLEKINELKNQLEKDNHYLREELELAYNYDEMVFRSPKFSKVLSDVESVAVTDATVLIQAETGTGKELIARAIHKISDRGGRPMIKLNCAALPKELIESELFGHVKGAFTGALKDRIGKFELAHKGTLFLDEIGEMPLELQPKLLRALQEGEIERVGGSHHQKVDVRIIAATNRDLKAMVEEGKFREDLYFRLNVFPLSIPPLRERPLDVIALTGHFLTKFCKKHGRNIKFIDDNTMDYLKTYNWPGNVRELENMIERAVIISNGDTLAIPELAKDNTYKTSVDAISMSLDDVQRAHILKVLELTNWKISGKNGAAVLLGLKPSTLRDRMSKLKLVRP